MLKKNKLSGCLGLSSGSGSGSGSSSGSGSGSGLASGHFIGPHQSITLQTN